MVYIIAEIANTHEGSVGLAKKFIEAAASAGADAVKFQTHMFEHESLENAPNPPYFNEESRKDYFKRTAFSFDQYRALKDFAKGVCGVDFISSPFSLEAVEFLEEVGMDALKIPSGEVTNIPLIDRVAQSNKHIFLSSGMSTWRELSSAVDILVDGRTAKNITVMQCTSEYPCKAEHVGLNNLQEMKTRFPGVRIGLSDHTIGAASALAAVAMGAVAVEKHFTLSKLMYGSDAKTSMEPGEFRAFVEEIRFLEKVLANPVDKDQMALGLKEMKTVFEKTVVAGRELDAGSVLKVSDLSFKKPMCGVPAQEYKTLIGKKLARAVPKDHVFKSTDFS